MKSRGLELYIKDYANLLRKISKFAKHPEKLYIITDFDRTLTYTCINNKKIPSLISVLRDPKFGILGEDYIRRAHELFNKYHPYEHDPSLNIEEKNSLMQRWWREHYSLLIEKGLRRQDIDKAVSYFKGKLREYVKEFFRVAHEYKVPIIIISSCGLGSYAVHKYLDVHGINYDNVYVISNELEWDSNGKMVGWKEPLITGFSKYLINLKEFRDIYEVIKDKDYGLVFGDNEDDYIVGKNNSRDMIAIGFVMRDVQNFDILAEEYNALITNDGDFSFAFDVFKRIIKQPF